MNTRFDLRKADSPRLVYIRPVNVADLPQGIQDQAGGSDKIYGVHSSDGLCLALVKDRQLAFALARQNDFAPVGVH